MTHIGRVLLLEAAALLSAVSVSLIYRENAMDLILTALIALVLGAVLLLIGRKRTRRLSTRGGFAVAFLSWLMLALVGAVPFVFAGLSPADAFFETVSGFTTTGATILTDVESLNRGLLFWRSLSHWLGGMGILVLSVALSEKTAGDSARLLSSEMPGHSVDKLRPGAADTAKCLYMIYVALTVLEFVFLLAGGMSVYESLVHALATAGTGGFGIKADSLASYSPYLQWVVTVFMLLFGVNFGVFFLLLLGKGKNVRKNNELWTYLSIFALAVAVITLNIRGLYADASESLRQSAFQVASVMSTTGFATADYGAWPCLSQAILFLLMFLGGCMGSTAGGLKISRLVCFVQMGKNGLRRSFEPHAVRLVRLNGRSINENEQSGLAAYLTLYLAVLVVCMLVISFEPFGLETNLSAAVSCLNNIGPALGRVGAAADYSMYSDFSKLVLSLTMLMGRLELYPILSLLRR